MTKIAFSCPWPGYDAAALLKGMSRLTPNNDGVWEDLVGTADVYAADWIVAAEDVDPTLDFSRIDPNKIILIGREPPWIANQNWNRHSTPYKFKPSLGNSYNLSGGASWPSTYKEVSAFNWRPRKKKVCVITSNKRMCSGHIQRLEFIKKFCHQYPGVLDVYGTGMASEGLGAHYKGVSTFGDLQKLEWLSQYEYAFCPENGQLDGYFSEKLNDAFLAYTVPIYWGAPDIENYFPSQSLYELDINHHEACERMMEIVSCKVSPTTIEMITMARQKILTEYSWWPTIKRILDTGQVLIDLSVVK
jgi:hypothetical protein